MERFFGIPKYVAENRVEVAQSVLIGSAVSCIGAIIIFYPNITPEQTILALASTAIPVLTAEELPGIVDKVDFIKGWLTFRGSNRFRVIEPVNYDDYPNIISIEDYRRDKPPSPSA